MDRQKVDIFITTNQKFFPSEKIMYLKDKLSTVSDEKFATISAVKFKNPTAVLVVSILLGTFGIDRFIIGDVLVGVLKLLTVGLCGVLTIFDWFTISKKAKEMNFNNIITFL